MKTGGPVPKFIVLIVSGILLMSCLLPGMIPLNSESTATAEPAATSEPAATTASTGTMPTMEMDADVLLQKLQAGEFVYLAQLAEETYTEEDFAKPGRLSFTVTVGPAEDKPTYFNYGWCTTTQEILEQNFQHIRVGLFFNGEQLGTDVVHPITYTRPDGFVCLDFGVLMSGWAAGEYQLTAIATFNEKINDGAADFEAGDYVYEYNVTVTK
jgi:hypothetical protein